MGSDESHFNVSLIVRDKVTRQCPQITIFEEKGEPKRIRTEVLLLTSLHLTARPNRLTNCVCDHGPIYTGLPVVVEVLLYVHRKAIQIGSGRVLHNIIRAFFGRTEPNRIRHVRSGPILAVRWP